MLGVLIRQSQNWFCILNKVLCSPRANGCLRFNITSLIYLCLCQNRYTQLYKRLLECVKVRKCNFAINFIGIMISKRVLLFSFTLFIITETVFAIIFQTSTMLICIRFLFILFFVAQLIIYVAWVVYCVAACSNGAWRFSGILM